MLQVVTGTVPCGQQMMKYCMDTREQWRALCQKAHEESGSNWNGELLGVQSKWDPIRKKLARRLDQEKNKALRSYFAQKGGAAEQERGQGQL